MGTIVVRASPADRSWWVRTDLLDNVARNWTDPIRTREGGS